jgi:hypothetical protein
MFKTDRTEEKEKDLQSAETFRTVDDHPIKSSRGSEINFWEYG